MIPSYAITEWSNVVPWVNPHHVEQDLPEPIGTKIRALYQRNKGRDLFDLFKILDTGLDSITGEAGPGSEGQPLSKFPKLFNVVFPR
jgi:hypothetical protein